MMLRRYFPLLFEPFPDDDSLPSIIKTSIWTAIIVFLVLFLFKPVNIGPAPSPIYYPVIFGLISGFMAFLVECIITYVLQLDRQNKDWVFWKWMVMVAILISLIALVNYAFILWHFDLSFSVKALLEITLGTWIVAIIPTLIFGGWGMIRQLRRNRIIAEEYIRHHDNPLTSSSQIMRLSSPAISEEDLEISPDQLLFIQAMQNYVQVFWEADEPQSQTMRGSLKSYLDQIEHPDIIQCHRSYVVNKSRISAVSGNAQGLELTLDGYPMDTIPVSRKYVPLFR